MTEAQVKGVDVESRARMSRGVSESAIYEAIAGMLASRHPGGGTLVDVGCGTGDFWSFVSNRFDRYMGVDVVAYDGFPSDQQFVRINVDDGQIPLEDNIGDVVTAVETIEHLENPRAFVRQLVRFAKPGGWIVITTPNQLSFLSKLTLVIKNQFNAFTDRSYPAHLTALLECDLRRIASENNLLDVHIGYTCSGRIPGTGSHYPRAISRARPRWFSDNVVLVTRKPAGFK